MPKDISVVLLGGKDDFSNVGEETEESWGLTEHKFHDGQVKERSFHVCEARLRQVERKNPSLIL